MDYVKPERLQSCESAPAKSGALSSFGYSVGFDADTPAGAELVAKAIELLARTGAPSIATIERELRAGYSASAAIMAELEKRGIVSSPIPGTNGERRFFGEGPAGRAAFLALAAELRAGTEPPAHWWHNLSEAAQRRYLPAGDGLRWSELKDADRARLRLRYWKNLDQYRALQAQFAYTKGAGK